MPQTQLGLKSYYSFLWCILLYLAIASSTYAGEVTDIYVSSAGIAVYGPITQEPTGPLDPVWGDSPNPAVESWAHPAWAGQESWLEFSGAQWISDTYYVSGDPSAESWRLFSLPFNVPANATNISATLWANSDNAEAIYLNGAWMGMDGKVFGPSNTEENWSTAISYELLPTAGENTLEIIGRNYARAGSSIGDNPVGLIYRLEVSYDYCEGIEFSEFTSIDDLTIVGSTYQLGNSLRLTDLSSFQSGAAWLTNKQLLDEGFTTTFSFWISNDGADGLVFVIQNVSNVALGANGGGIGYQGIPNSLAVEFDTYRNLESDPGFDSTEGNGNHISIQSMGLAPNLPGSLATLGETSAIPFLSDGQIHTAQIKYTPGLLTVFIDDLITPVLSVLVDLENLLDLDNGEAWIGFTSATGAGTEVHDILDWSFNGCPPLLLAAPGRPSPVVGDGIAFLSWKDNEGDDVAGYEISVSDATTGEVVSVHESPVHFSLITDLINGKRYEAVVRAFDSIGIFGEYSLTSPIFMPSQRTMPQETIRPILLVHGLNGTAEGTWKYFREKAKAEGWNLGGDARVIGESVLYDTNVVRDTNAKLYRIDFSDNQGAIRTQAKELARVVDNILAGHSDDKITLVGHSMGGLASRAFMQNIREAGEENEESLYTGQVRRLVTTGTPHRGSRWAEAKAIIPFDTFGDYRLGSDAIRDMTPGSDFLKELNAPPISLPSDGESYGTIVNEYKSTKWWKKILDDYLTEHNDLVVSAGSQNLDHLLRNPDYPNVFSTKYTLEEQSVQHVNEPEQFNTLVKAIKEEYIEATVFSPATLLVQDSLGRIIDIDTIEIPGGEYTQYDFDGDGELDDRIFILLPDHGEYTVTLVPDEGVDPDDTYGLRIEQNGEVLTELHNQRIGDVPEEPIAHLISNTDPIADAGVDITVECTGPTSTTVQLDGSLSSDPDEDDISYEWFEGGASIATGVNPDILLSLGQHTIVLRVTDSFDAMHEDSVQITVEDTTAPTLSLSSSTHVLWPANHKMNDVHVNVTSTDVCDSAPAITLVSATSSDADDGIGDGNTKADIQDATLSTADFDVKLRAERSSKTEGRVYTLVYRATDASGNTTDAQIDVEVPYDSSSHQCDETDCSFSQN